MVEVVQRIVGEREPQPERGPPRIAIRARTHWVKRIHIRRPKDCKNHVKANKQNLATKFVYFVNKCEKGSHGCQSHHSATSEGIFTYLNVFPFRKNYHFLSKVMHVKIQSHKEDVTCSVS